MGKVSTVLADVKPEQDIVQQELFGPVAVIMKASDEQEAVRLIPRMDPVVRYSPKISISRISGRPAYRIRHGACE
ncbi:aldehyde dehydrogenase family protein [Paenibacillus sp. Z3-2]